MTKSTDEARKVQTGLARGTLGTASVAFFVVAAAAPLLVMAGVAPLAIGFGGVGAPSGYLIAGVTLAIFAVGFTAMTKYIHNAGAFYAYISREVSVRPRGSWRRWSPWCPTTHWKSGCSARWEASRTSRSARSPG